MDGLLLKNDMMNLFSGNSSGFRIFPDFPGFFRIFPDFSGFFRIFPDFLKYPGSTIFINRTIGSLLKYDMIYFFPEVDRVFRIFSRIFLKSSV